MREKRKRIWIDRFQTMLVIRVGLYCVLYQVLLLVLQWALGQFAAATEAVGGESLLSSGLFRGLVVLVALTPILILDTIKFTHRLVGPIYRFRKTVQAIAADEPVDWVRLREGDLLQDMKDDFNGMLRLLEQKGYVVHKVPSAAIPAGADQPASRALFANSRIAMEKALARNSVPSNS